MPSVHIVPSQWGQLWETSSVISTTRELSLGVSSGVILQIPGVTPSKLEVSQIYGLSKLTVHLTIRDRNKS